MDFESETQRFLKDIRCDKHMFSATIAFIDQWYDTEKTAFQNGPVSNLASENQGSAKVLALGVDLALTTEQVLRCFGEHYRDVMAHPAENNHHNLRRVLRDGFHEVSFERYPLQRKSTSIA